jgi:hypothetical protein
MFPIEANLNRAFQRSVELSHSREPLLLERSMAILVINCVNDLLQMVPRVLLRHFALPQLIPLTSLSAQQQDWQAVP